jgi:hypothetical protein
VVLTGTNGCCRRTSIGQRRRARAVVRCAPARCTSHFVCQVYVVRCMPGIRVRYMPGVHYTWYARCTSYVVCQGYVYYACQVYIVCGMPGVRCMPGVRAGHYRRPTQTCPCGTRPCAAARSATRTHAKPCGHRAVGYRGDRSVGYHAECVLPWARAPATRCTPTARTPSRRTTAHRSTRGSRRRRRK